MTIETISLGRLQELLRYEPDTGNFFWVSRPGKRVSAGQLAGTSVKGYCYIRIDSRRYAAHRLAWLWTHEAWPAGDIDHINGVPADNRISNLRDVSRTINNQNRRSASRSNQSCGLLGASFNKATGTWNAHITYSGKQHNLGYFLTPELAHTAYLKAKRQFHPGCTI